MRPGPRYQRIGTLIQRVRQQEEQLATDSDALTTAASKVKEQLKADPKKSAQSNFQFQWILGLNDSDAALERAKEFSLARVADKVTCPVLITHGANDRVVPVEAAHKLYAALTTGKKTLRIFTAEEGGAEHCQVDNRPLGINYIADWIAANVQPGPDTA